MSQPLALEPNRRIDWVDVAKGLGIILVVMQHTSLDYGPVGKFINSFHMPLFFFLSGFFFSLEKYGSFRPFAAKISRSLLIPYFAFAFLSYGYFLLRYNFGDTGYYRDLNVYQQLGGIFYSAGLREWMDFNLPLWFLTCLFIVEVMFYWIRRLVKSDAGVWAILAACSVIGYADGLWNPRKLPWGIDVAFTAVVFFGIGHLLRKPVRQMLSWPAWYRLAAFALLLGVNFLSTLNRVNLNMKLHGDYYDFYISAAAGVAFTLLLASLIRSKALLFLGRNAMLIMACHMPVLNLASKVTDRIGPFPNVYGLEFTRVSITMVVLVPVIYFINAFMPFLLGKSRSPAGPSGMFQTAKSGKRIAHQ